MFDSGEAEAMGDAELIEALRRAHGAAAFAQAAEITAIREVYRRHRAGNAEPGPGGIRAGEFAAAEVAVAVQVSEAVAAALIDIGLALDSLPQTRLAFAAGRIDLSRVQVITEAMRGLAREVREALEPKLIEAATRSEPSRLRQTARRWVIRLDPEGEQRRREARESDRDVRIRAVHDGMAVFDGLLPAAGAQTVAMRLREMSLQVCEDDPRTMPQRRADALVALADGTGRLRCGCTHGKNCPQAGAPTSPRRPLIQVGMSAETLLGLRDDPAFLSGFGPVDAALARTLAEHARFQVIPEYFAPTSDANQSIASTADDPSPSAASDPRPSATPTTRDRSASTRPAPDLKSSVTRADTDPSPSTATPGGDQTPSATTAIPDLLPLAARANADTNPSAATADSDPSPSTVTRIGGPRSSGARRNPTAPMAPWERSAGLYEVPADSVAPEALRAAARQAAGSGAPGAHPAGSKRNSAAAKVEVSPPFSAAPPREVRAFDGLCRFPGCTMPAAETLLSQFDSLRMRRPPQASAAPRAVLCSHHHRLKALADSGKQPWRVYLADTDRMRWIDPSGESHETIREGARYLFPHTDIDAPAKPPHRPYRLPEEPTPLPTPATTDIAYPLDTHVLLHPQLSRSTPENDIPTLPARPSPR
ncbi:DUF222 domain-containing protein [Nocardia sp. NPDC006630]|uniref:DUF222 domain-containing protein n=1 Tax=Nocardia sp. NPDC006630 TaxID=3157181 RepID=UPI0033B6F9DF